MRSLRFVLVTAALIWFGLAAAAWADPAGHAATPAGGHHYPLFSLHNLIALIALSAMEIVLGIDNIVFISVISARLPVAQQALARRIGLLVAMGTRILLLCSLNFVLNLKHPVFQFDKWGLPAAATEWLTAHPEINDLSWRDIILLVGGLFLLWSSVKEIHHKIEGHHDDHAAPARVTFRGVILQIAVLDIIFSLDSVITAVGMAESIEVMIAAVIIAVGVMLVFAGTVSTFVERHPTVKMLALSFLLLIGVMLVAEGIGTHFSKGYVYFAMAFALGVEVLNLRAQAKAARKQKAEH
ncbi:MAG: TerC family protein [Pirellulaceae bacterium]|nr:TerC family protein [Pirellulaceae bacterium]